MATKKFPKSALKEIDVIEGRMILHHWAGLPTEEVINLIMPEKVLASLEENQDCILTGDIEADFLNHLNPDTVAFLVALREYMEGTRPRVPKRAAVAETLQIDTDAPEKPAAKPEVAPKKEEPKEEAPVVKPKKKETPVALKTKSFGNKAEATPEPEPEAPAVDVEGLEAKLDALTATILAMQTEQSATNEMLHKQGRVLAFLVSEGVLDEDSFDNLDDLYEAIEG